MYCLCHYRCAVSRNAVSLVTKQEHERGEKITLLLLLLSVFCVFYPSYLCP